MYHKSWQLDEGVKCANVDRSLTNVTCTERNGHIISRRFSALMSVRMNDGAHAGHVGWSMCQGTTCQRGLTHGFKGLFYGVVLSGNLGRWRCAPWLTPSGQKTAITPRGDTF